MRLDHRDRQDQIGRRAHAHDDVQDLLDSVFEADYVTVDISSDEARPKAPEELEKLPEMIAELREKMFVLAEDMKYEEAAELRDQIKRLEQVQRDAG